MNMLEFWGHETGVKLRLGENLICSPLRKDTHPSFSLNTLTGLWFDHGTAQGGNVFDFIMIKYNYSFPEAKEHIENSCGTLFDNTACTKLKAIEKPIRQGAKEDYRFLEVVKNGIYHRGVFEQHSETPDYYSIPGETDCFHSMYRHSSGVIDYHKQHGDLKGYVGSVWCKEMVFDVDCKVGTVAENIAKALDETRKLFQLLKNTGITSSAKFSGSKGFHVSFTHSALDALSGYTDTPRRVELLARKMAAVIGGVDFSIYSSSTRLIRSPNSVNSKSGLYAIPLTESDILSFTPTQVISLAQKPRKIIQYPIKCFSRLLGEQFTINSNGIVKFDSGVTFIRSEIAQLHGEKDKKAIMALYQLKSSFGGDII